MDFEAGSKPLKSSRDIAMERADEMMKNSESSVSSGENPSLETSEEQSDVQEEVTFTGAEEQPDRTQENSENIGSPEITSPISEEDVKESMSTENRRSFGAMSPEAKKIMREAGDNWKSMRAKAFEGAYGQPNREFAANDNLWDKTKKVVGRGYDFLYKVPGVRRVVGKMEIAYNQFWINRHEGKAGKHKQKMDNIDVTLSILDKEKAAKERVIENLRQKGMSTESMELEIKKIERQKNEMAVKKDRSQTKVEKWENKSKMYTNERDRVADTLIGEYNKKLEPMEQRLEGLHRGRKLLELELSILEKDHDKEIAELEVLKKEKNDIEDMYRSIGGKERDIRKSVKSLETAIAMGAERVRKERAKILEKKQALEKTIAKADKKANPYRDKRAEFIRVKEGRPIDMKTEERKRKEDISDKEEATIHTRTENGPEASRNESVPEEDASKDAGTEEENDPENEWAAEVLLEKWNEFLKSNYPEDARGKVDSKDFFEAVGSLGGRGLAKDEMVDFDNFKNILKNYCDLKDMPLTNFEERMLAFIKDNKKS